MTYTFSGVWRKVVVCVFEADEGTRVGSGWAAEALGRAQPSSL